MKKKKVTYGNSLQNSSNFIAIEVNSMYEVITLTASVHSTNWKIRANYSFQRILTNFILYLCGFCFCFCFRSLCVFQSIHFLMDELRSVTRSANTKWSKHPFVMNELNTAQVKCKHRILLSLCQPSFMTCETISSIVLYCRLNSFPWRYSSNININTNNNNIVEQSVTIFI